MSSKQLNLLTALALGFFFGKVVIWLLFGFYLYLTGRLHG